MKLQMFYFISVNLNWFKQKSKLMQRIVQKIYLLNVCLLLELFVKNHPYFFSRHKFEWFFLFQCYFIMFFLGTVSMIVFLLSNVTTHKAAPLTWLCEVWKRFTILYLYNEIIKLIRGTLKSAAISILISQNFTLKYLSQYDRMYPY